MNPAIQFLELIDKNASNIFNEFINKYQLKKIKPIKPIKEEKIKLIKPIKEEKIKLIKPIKEKIKSIKTINIKKYINIIKKLIHTIENYKLYSIEELEDFNLLCKKLI